jgi:predicted DNA-binding transcriptional regulator YafY
MPTVKNAFERHKVLDRCFRDRTRKYYIEDLVWIVNKDTLYYYGTSVSERTIRKDIAYMMDSEGYSAPITKGMDGHRAYYYYNKRDYSIMNLPMSQDEMRQLSDTIKMLSRFKGMPDCTWMEEVLARFEDTFQLTDLPKGIVSFAQNPYLIGMSHFSSLFEGIVKKSVLYITYHKFRKPSVIREIHPYQLRQYNNRWFLIGYEPCMSDKLPVVTIPLDRIETIQYADNLVYQEYRGSDLDEYFNQVVGVSVNIGAKRETIVIKASFPAAAYMETKPIHRSQKIIERSDDYIVFEYNLIPNYEFETILLGYMDECEIIRPLFLRHKLHDRALKIAENNK